VSRDSGESGRFRFPNRTSAILKASLPCGGVSLGCPFAHLVARDLTDSCAIKQLSRGSADDQQDSFTKCCPVCGGDSLQPVERHALGTAVADTKNISGLLGFRCGKGHTFLIG